MGGEGAPYASHSLGLSFLQFCWLICIDCNKHQRNTMWAFTQKHDIFFVKITCYLHTGKVHHCYGYIINRVFHNKKLLRWNCLVFHWCLYENRILHGCLEIPNFSSCVQEIFVLSAYFSTLAEKSCISAWPCNILYIFCSLPEGLPLVVQMFTIPGLEKKLVFQPVLFASSSHILLDEAAPRLSLILVVSG